MTADHHRHRVSRSVLLSLFGLLALGSVAACDRSESADTEQRLFELERLAFVPAFDVTLPPRASDRYADCSIEEPILMDRFELTRGQIDAYYARFAEGVERRADSIEWTTAVARDADGTADWPAFLSWDEAVLVAEWRGMRLPTAREWIHVAVGRRGLSYPWGGDQMSVANTAETGIAQPTPVGTFENGRSRLFDCYDMVGNVWEWVEGAVPGYRDDEVDLAATPSRVPQPLTYYWALEEAYRTGPNRRVSVLGGSFLTERHPTYGAGLSGESGRILFHARRLEPGTLSPDIGVRMCADARRYLTENAAFLGDGDAVRTRVTEVGRRWSRDATARDGLVELLESIIESEGDLKALGWLLDGARIWDVARENR